MIIEQKNRVTPLFEIAAEKNEKATMKGSLNGKVACSSLENVGNIEMSLRNGTFECFISDFSSENFC